MMGVETMPVSDKGFLSGVPGDVLLVHEDSASRALRVRDSIFGSPGSDSTPEQLSAVENSVEFWSEESSRLRPYSVRNGTLVIPVQGILLDRLSVTLGGFATGYEYIIQALRRGADDGEVDQIVLDVGSPGGIVSGITDVEEAIIQARQQKPVFAAVSGAALSSAYWIAAVTNEIIADPTSMVGGIGVVATHVDISGRLENEGIVVTHVHAGARKVDTYPEVPLSEEARRDIESRVNGVYEMFVRSVSEGRAMSESSIRDTEARIYLSDRGAEIGLVDRVGSTRPILAGASFAGDEQREDEDMTTKTSAGNNGSETKPGDTSASVEATAGSTPAPDPDAIRSEARSEGYSAGVADERARISAILAADEAKSRPKLAHALAMANDGMTVESARSILSAAPGEVESNSGPVGQGSNPGQNFDAAMTAGGNPGVSAQPNATAAPGTDSGEPDSDADPAAFTKAVRERLGFN